MELDTAIPLQDSFNDQPVIAPAALERMSRLDALEDEIARAASHLTAMEYYFIKLIGDFDDDDGWVNSGARSFPHWLNWKCGINQTVGREKVRVARRLRELPVITEAFRTGQVSYSKVRSITRIATPENEDYLVELATHSTCDQLDRICRCYTRVFGAEEEEPETYTRFDWHKDDDGTVLISARLPEADGMLVIQALKKMRDEISAGQRAKAQESRNENDAHSEDNENEQNARIASREARITCGQEEDFEYECSSALARICEHYLATDQGARTLSGADKYQIVLHVNANPDHPEYQMKQQPACYRDDGWFMTPEVARQIACDASIKIASEDDQGNVLNIGRKSRKVPQDIALAVRIRDKGCCRFPQCSNSRWTEQHHIQHWADGGETSVENLITLCRYHHSLHHKGDYELQKQGDGVVFRSKFGTEIPVRLQAPGDGRDAMEVVREIKSWHREQGIKIDHDTIVPGWWNEPCDLNWALENITNCT